MKIVVIDGQGGRMGKGLIEALRNKGVKEPIYAIGTNGVATSLMIKAGADYGATGENPLVVACRDADIIAGPVGIVIADSLLGEITPKMAIAVGQSRAEKFLLPVNRCNNHIVGIEQKSVSDIVDVAADMIVLLIKK